MIGSPDTLINQPTGRDDIGPTIAANDDDSVFVLASRIVIIYFILVDGGVHQIALFLSIKVIALNNA